MSIVVKIILYTQTGCTRVWQLTTYMSYYVILQQLSNDFYPSLKFEKYLKCPYIMYRNIVDNRNSLKGKKIQILQVISDTIILYPLHPV